MIPSVLASAKLVASYAAVSSAIQAMPSAAPLSPFTSTSAIQGEAPVPKPPPSASKPQLKFIDSGYFDVGYEKLIGLFSDQIVHVGYSYGQDATGQDDLTAYFRNTTLDTRGTGLPYPQAVQGTTVGIAYRHWFPKHQMFATIETGDTIGGPFEGKTDTRYGLVGYTDWTHGANRSDLYSELFYIALEDDTFFDIRLRSGRTFAKDKAGNYYWLYLAGQGWASGQTETGTENRVEAGPGIAYVFRRLNLSVNFDLRGGYSFRGDIPNKVYFNPTLIISAGFY